MVKLTRAIVRELLDYQPDTGVLTWKWRRRRWFTSARDWRSWNVKHTGKVAFPTIRYDGYLHGRIFGKRYLAHRVIWFWQTGRWPPEVDHDNHDRHDNRWRNLFQTTHLENQHSRASNRNNTSGHTGIFKRPNGTFQAHIGVGGRLHHLGIYLRRKDAIAARKAAERKYGFHPHGKPRRKKKWLQPFVRPLAKEHFAKWLTGTKDQHGRVVRDEINGKSSNLN
jgi:hypothetical protein